MTTQKPAVVRSSSSIVDGAPAPPSGTRFGSNRTLTTATYPCNKWLISDPLVLNAPESGIARVTVVYQALQEIAMLYTMHWEFKSWFVINGKLVVDQLPDAPAGWSGQKYGNETNVSGMDFNFSFSRAMPVSSGALTIYAGGYLMWDASYWYKYPYTPTIEGWDQPYDWSIDLVTVVGTGSTSNAYYNAELNETWFGFDDCNCGGVPAA